MFGCIAKKKASKHRRKVIRQRQPFVLRFEVMISSICLNHFQLILHNQKDTILRNQKPYRKFSTKTVIINHLRQASRGRGMFALSLLSLLLFLRIRGNFSLSWSMILKVDSFLSVSTELLLTRPVSQLLLGSLSLIKPPIEPFLEGRMVSSSLFSLSLRSKVDSLNFSLGKRQSCLRMRVLWSSPSADGLSLGDGAKHKRTNASRSCEYNSGILSHTPFSIFLRSPGRSAARNGGLIAAISYSTHPKDQRSHLAVQGRSPHTSGLEQQGVPV